MTNRAASTDSPQSHSAELRAAWVAHDSLETSSSRQSLMNTILSSRLNSVFVAAPPLGSNWGEGTVEHFVEFVNLAKGEGMVVLGWISNFKRTHPTPADLSSPSERDEQAKWAEDVMEAFPCLDGIAIDYIRYPKWEPSSEVKNNGVTETVRRIREVTDAADKVLLSTCFPAATVTFRGIRPSQWEGQVPQWYQQWYNSDASNYFALEAKDGGTGIVNQGNVNGTERPYLLGPSFMSYQQDPLTWMKKGYVDHVTPMQYTADVDVMKKEIEAWSSLTSYNGADMSQVNLGLGWMDEPTSFPDSAFDPSSIVAHVRNGRGAGVGGYTFFRMGIPGIDDTPLVEALTVPVASNGYADPPFPDYVDSTLGVPSMELCVAKFVGADPEDGIDGELQPGDPDAASGASGGGRQYGASPPGHSMLLSALLLSAMRWALRS